MTGAPSDKSGERARVAAASEFETSREPVTQNTASETFSTASSTGEGSAQQKSAESLTAGAAGAGDLYGESFAQADFVPSAGGGDTATASESGFRCQHCRKPIQSEYYTLNAQPFCTSCRPELDAALQAVPGGFVHALSYGFGAALLGSAVYYGIRLATGYELAIIAIGIGIVVGKAVRKGAGLNPHWIYRALGIGLTYLSVCLNYAPDVLKASEMGNDLGSLLTAVVFSLGVPLLFVSQGEFIAILIIGVGLWEGWKHSAPPAVSFEGPFQVKPPSPEVT